MKTKVKGILVKVAIPGCPCYSFEATILNGKLVDIDPVPKDIPLDKKRLLAFVKFIQEIIEELED